MSDLQKRFSNLSNEKDFPADENIGLTLRERRMIFVALQIADAAVRHHDTLIGCAEGKGNILTDPGLTAAEIYKYAEHFKHWRDGAN